MNIKGKGWADRQRTKIARQNDINRLTYETIERNKRVERARYEDVERRLKYFEKAYNDAKNDADFQKKISERLRESFNKSIRAFFFLGLTFACIVIYIIFF
jgi:ATP-dependent Lon protease